MSKDWFTKINKDWLTLIILSAVFLSIFWPILFGSKVIVGKWNIFDHYPRLAFIDRAIDVGESLIWTESFLGGFPIFLGAWGDHINPVSIIFLKFFDFIPFTHWFTFINLLLSGFIGYKFLKALGLTFQASLLGSSVYALNQWTLFYSSPSFLGNGFLVIPAIFLCVLKFSQNPRYKKYLFWLSIVLAWGWISVLADIMLYITLAALFFSIFLDFSLRPRVSVWKKFKTVRFFILALIIGVMLALPRLLPIVGSLEDSVRSGGVEESSSFLQSFQDHGYAGFKTLVKLFLPYFSVPYSDFIPFLNGADNLTFFYIGFIPMFLLILFFVDFKNNLLANKTNKFFFFLFLVTLLMVLKYVPLFWLLHKLPVFKLFGGAGKVTYLMFFSLAVILGIVFDRLAVIKESLTFKKRSKLILIGCVLFGLALLSVHLALHFGKDKILEVSERYFIDNLYGITKQKPLEHYRELMGKVFSGFSYNFSIYNLHYITSLLVLLSGFIAFLLFIKNKITTDFFKKSSLVIVLISFVVLWQSFFDLVSEELILQPPETIQYLLDKKETEPPFRVFRFWDGLSQYEDAGLNVNDLEEKTLLETSLLSPNYSLLYDLDFIGGHENIMSARHSELMAFIGSERAPKNQTWIFDQKLPLEEKIARFESPTNRSLLSMMNVRYIVASSRFSSPWREVFKTEVTSSKIPVYIYENPDYLPRVFLAENIIFTKSSSESFSALLQSSNFKKNTVVECSNCDTFESRPNLKDKLEIKTIKGGYLEVSTYNEFPRWLVFSESNLPSWNIEINGEPTKSFMANYIFHAVLLPAGDNSIVFLYPNVFKQTQYAALGLWQRYLEKIF